MERRADTGQRSPGEERLPTLDGLRGIAILMVVFFHATVVGSATPGEALLHGVFRNFGWAGVDLFFVLSGFLITGILFESKGAPRALRNFYVRRALRIFPLYYGFLVLIFALAPRLAPGVLTVGDDAVFYWVYLQNFATAAAGDWVHSRFLNLFWSLAIEEHFYLVWPWVVMAASRATLLRVCVGVALASLLLRVALVAADVAPVAVYVLTPARLDGLAAGAFVALCLRGPAGLKGLVGPARRALALGAGALLAIVLVQRGFSYMLPLTATLGLSLLALCFGALLVLVLAAGRGSALGRLLTLPPLVSYGRYSYAIYVLHQVVLVAATHLLVERVFEPHLPGASTLALQLALYACVVPVSWALGWLSWHAYEKRFLALKRFFPTRSPRVG